MSHIVTMLTGRDTSAWKPKIKERDEGLNKLEEAEVRYIQSFRLVKTPSNGRRLETMQQPSDTASGSPRTDANDFIGPKGEVPSYGPSRQLTF